MGQCHPHMNMYLSEVSLGGLGALPPSLVWSLEVASHLKCESELRIQLRIAFSAQRLSPRMQHKDYETEGAALEPG